MRREQPNLTIILITHDLEEATLADRVLVLNKGRLVMDGPPSTIFTRVEQLKAMSLNVPFLYQLIGYLPKNQQEHITTLDDVLKVLS
jgi:energy-coupling factor transport system ATP-binding protein